MLAKQETIAVRCTVPGKLFGRRFREAQRVLMMGALVDAMGPYEMADGMEADGWPLHFATLDVYAEHDGMLYPLVVADEDCYRTCERYAIEKLRQAGHLPDPDYDFALQYG